MSTTHAKIIENIIKYTNHHIMHYTRARAGLTLDKTAYPRTLLLWICCKRRTSDTVANGFVRDTYFLTGSCAV